jgi:hypothetical protein
VKKLTAAIFVLIFLFQAFYSTAVTYWFYFNRSYIAEKLCINRDKPELKCKGNCYLAKKLKEAESQKKDDANFQLKEWVSISPFILSTCTVPFSERSTFKITFSQRSDDYQYLHLQAIFHPPMAV